MSFGFSAEQEQLRRTAREFLIEFAPMEVAREVVDGPATHSPQLWRRMAELGWMGLSCPVAYGGAGLGAVELAIVVEELGRSLAPVPFVPTAMAGSAIALAGDAAQREQWLPAIAAGNSIATCALDGLNPDWGPSLTLAAEADGDGWRLEGCVRFVPDAGIADWVVLPARIEGSDGDGVGLFVVERDAPQTAITPMLSIDPLRTLYTLEFKGAVVSGDALLGGRSDSEPALRRALDLARVMVAAEMLGGAQWCLESAVEHAKSRVQFGKPIGAYQAIKHKCADMLFELESAKSITYYAAWAAGAADDEAPLAAAMAKAYVGDAFRRISAENIQIHGGVGFTWEYDCHLFFKRANANASWLGDSHCHRERVAQLLEI